MEGFTIALLIGQLLFWVSCIFILIYLIAKRIDLKKKEDFEDRDN